MKVDVISDLDAVEDVHEMKEKSQFVRNTADLLSGTLANIYDVLKFALLSVLQMFSCVLHVMKTIFYLLKDVIRREALETRVDYQ